MTSLPDFPWDRLAPYAATARAHPGGIVDLSVGTPVDPTPPLVQQALAAAADAPGYPLTAGSLELREAIVGWLARRFGAQLAADAVLPVIGTKELVAWLPTLLGARTVGFPALAYPTYDVGARLAGAAGRVVEGTVGVGPERLDLVWVNSPANPTGRVLPPEHLAKVVAWARERATVLASDECYADLYYDDPAPMSVLSPEVSGPGHEGLLAVHSLSKRSNLAGYRAGFVAGDPALVARLLEVRKHAGMIVPAPVQAAMVAALGDDAHVVDQRRRYAARRTSLLGALTAQGFTVEDSTAGLYLWATRDEACWNTVGWLADRGILVAPGEFYGAAGARHVRVALTATDERVAAATARLSADALPADPLPADALPADPLTAEPDEEGAFSDSWRLLRRARRAVRLRPMPGDDTFSDLLAANAAYAESFSLGGLSGTAGRGLAVLTCMDSRIEPLAMLGLQPGDAKILRNAGARVTEDVLRTLALARYLLGVERVMVVAHTKCRMAGGSEDDVHAAVAAAGGPDTRSISFLTTRDQPAALATDVQRIRSWPYLHDLVVGGFIYDVDTGRLQQLL